LKLAVFVDGCFWHGCPKHGREPGTNADYWVPKLSRNRMRDREVTRKLRADGVSVVRIWEHDIRRGSPTTVLRRLRRAAAV
jgi:DNA mismatch endonuclease (patch repair protein)